MAKSRPRKTLADYVAIAISPALIMLLIGSLVFFLQELGYSGQFGGRLKWILFWFVFASVLIARISIEEGDEHAAVYTVAFWGAIALVVFRFLDNYVVGFLLLGVTWWCAKKLTWDCTLIDDSEDASGQGLLQVTGLDGERSGEGEPASPAAESPDSEKPDQPNGDAKKPHAPGVWVVYFSLAALPLFGLGQVFLPADDEARRSAAFRYLWFYVAAGLALLLTTSFLGLRRYLRQRKLKMPASMTRGWIGMGTVLALGILIVCLVLPRPNAAYSLTKVVDAVSQKVGEASDYAMGGDDAGEGEGRRKGREAKEGEGNGKGEKGNDGEKAGETSKSGQPASGGDGKKDGPSEKDGGKKAQKGDGNSEKNNDDKESKTQAKGGAGEPKSADNGSSQKKNSTSGGASSIGETIAKLVKWLIYLAIAVAVVIYAIRHWRMILAGLIRFWRDLQEFFAGLFGRKSQRQAKTIGSAGLPEEKPVRPFTDYANPFRNGMEQNMGTSELIEYTYEALRAWGAEHGLPKSADQTPTEYVQELAHLAPELARPARQVALLYLQAAFSTNPPNRKCHDQLRQAWDQMERADSLAAR